MKLKKLMTSGLALAMLAGCSSGGGSAAAGSGSSSGGGSKGAGKSAVVQLDADLNTMDYEVATDGASFAMQTMCESGLTELDEKGQPKPDLAESWDVSEDHKTYTFHLRDAKWSNGDPVTAADFVYGWQRLVSPGLASEYNFLASTVCIENAAECISGDKPVTDLGVEAKDDKTFVVHLTQPVAFFLGLTAFPSFFPLNQKFFESQGGDLDGGASGTFAQSTDGMLYCGPYTMTDWVTGSAYTFKKNADYWDADNYGDSVDEVTFRFQQDTATAMMEFDSGKFDIVKLTSELVDQYKDKEGFTNRLTGYAWRLDFNFDDPTIKNENLRKAIMYGIDRQTICDDVLKDGSVAAEGFIPKDFAFGPDSKDYRDTAGKIVEFDAAKAGEYYEKAKAELGGDVKLELLCEDSESSQNVALNIKSMLEKNLPGSTFDLKVVPKKTRLDSMTHHEYQIGLTRWGPDYADPQTYMALMKSDVPGYNGSYSNDEYNALMNKAETGEDAVDAEKRWADIVEAEKLLIDDAAMVPVYQNGGAYMISTDIEEGVQFHNAGVDNYRHIVKA